MTVSPEKKGVCDLSIIIVNYNGWPYLRECLESLSREGRNKDWEVLVVDNGSEDGSEELVRRQFPGIRFFSLGKNIGFSRANNRGIKECRGDFILFLNPDTRVRTGSMDKLLDYLQQNPRVGAVGPALIGDKGRIQVSFGRKVHFFREFFQKVFLNIYYAFFLRYYKKQRVVGWLSGACLLTRKTVLERTGGFDPVFFLYFEDIDLCYRITGAGYNLFYLPEAEVFHQGGGITSGRERESRFVYRKSQLYFYKKHNSVLSQTLLRLFLRLHFMLLHIFGKLRGREGSRDYDSFLSLLKREPASAKEGNKDG
ncbi:MAG: glycosyltransferase family 2 protein [Candidatus Aminicenantes bacterium]|nr:glycosyltransferase family 2 protein [Candidatus Aminicenantes bacterium]